MLRHGRAYESFLEEGGRADADGQPSASRDRLPGLMRLSEALRTHAEPEAAAYRQWLEQQPPAVRFSLPDWLWEGLAATHGEQAEALAATLLLPAAIEIRSNLLKGKATALQKKLAEAGVAAETVPDHQLKHSPHARNAAAAARCPARTRWTAPWRPRPASGTDNRLS